MGRQDSVFKSTNKRIFILQILTGKKIHRSTQYYNELEYITFSKIFPMLKRREIGLSYIIDFLFQIKVLNEQLYTVSEIHLI